MEVRIERHAREIERCNQRGGRMLSILDLLDSGTLDREMSEYLLAAISGGRSFLVGAMPGGAGKTTIMGALLNFIPDVEIVPVENARVIRNGLNDLISKCFLAHEIGHGRWYAYIWGRDVENFLELTSNHVVAGNIHADDVDDVLSHDGIDESNITRLDLLIFLRFDRGIMESSRRICSILENQGGHGPAAFKPIYSWNPPHGSFDAVNEPCLVDEEDLHWARDTLDDVINGGLRTIRDVRSAVLEQLHRRNT